VNSLELVGWSASLILIITLMRQVYTQWRTRAIGGLSKWLFVGQCTASAGYVVYSVMLHNWVYVSSNIAILITALVGEFLYMRNRRRAQGSTETHPAQQPGRQ
jgi:uncharacterized protein with PQ loop repeat